MSRTLTVTIELAGVPVAFSSADPYWIDLVVFRYHAFATSVPAVFEVLHATRTAVPAEVPSPLAVHTAPVTHRAATRSRFELVGESFTALIDLEKATAHIDGPCALYPLDAVLRETLPLLLEDGVLLHGGAAVGDDGRGVVFCGESGAGKSTLGRLLDGRTLCDEMVGMCRTPNGAAIRPTPFWRARPGRASLAAIYALRHGPVHRRHRLEGADAVRELSRHVVWPRDHAAGLEHTFVTLSGLVETTPVWELEFVPRPDVWDVIRPEALR